MCLILDLEPRLHQTLNVIQVVVDLRGGEPPRLQDLSDVKLSQIFGG